MGWAEICCSIIVTLSGSFLDPGTCSQSKSCLLQVFKLLLLIESPKSSLPVFPGGAHIHPSHASPPTIAVIPTAQIVLTPQGVLAPLACSLGCHTFVSVHFRWVPVHNMLLFLRSFCSCYPVSFSLNPCPQAWHIWGLWFSSSLF